MGIEHRANVVYEVIGHMFVLSFISGQGVIGMLESGFSDPDTLHFSQRPVPVTEGERFLFSAALAVAGTLMHAALSHIFAKKR